jgi:hypothetical protein
MRNAVRNVVLSKKRKFLPQIEKAASCYSLRKIVENYNNSCVRVARSSDNSFLQIGFDSNNDFDINSYLAFKGNSIIYVTDFYDQLNGKHLIQYDAKLRPILDIDSNGKPYILDNANTRGLRCDSQIFTSSSSVIINNVWEFISYNPWGQNSQYSTSSTTVPSLYQSIVSPNTLQIYSGVYTTIGTIDNTIKVQTMQKIGGVVNGWINNQKVINNITNSNETSFIDGFYTVHPSFVEGSNIRTREIILFNSLSSVERELIGNDQLSYWRGN